MNDKKILIICEMANNHMGDISHGKLIIEEFSKICQKYKTSFNFAWKFQFRNFDTYIHQSYKADLDHKYIKRFTDTMLSKNEFAILKKHAEDYGFITMCTAFDEESIDNIIDMNFDILKIASCSYNDWPLLNKAINFNKPIIISTAGSSCDQLDNVVSFMQHRNKDISLMHCVGEYPTQANNLQLNQINFLQNRYHNIPIGYSTHENPEETDAIKLAIAKGIRLSEKHVALLTDKYAPNAYSVTPDQMDKWLSSALSSLNMCGIVNEKSQISNKELTDLLQFKRGAFVKSSVIKGEVITKNNIYYAWPNIDNQLLANDISKYNEFIATDDISSNSPIIKSNIKTKNTRRYIWNIVQDIKSFLKQSKVVFPGKAELEISHHYGIEKFYDTGITMITVVNREYCKKLIIVLPNQTHPEQYHKEKEETFLILHGDVELTLDDSKQSLGKGDIVTINKEVRHSFTTKSGCVIEEVSSTHHSDDSYYTDAKILDNKNRKTFVTHWL